MAWSFEFKVVCFLVLLVFLSGVGVAYSKFWVRTQTALLYQLQKEGDIAQAEWSQLLVERWRVLKKWQWNKGCYCQVLRKQL
jgi:cell division protein FtsL